MELLRTHVGLNVPGLATGLQAGKAVAGILPTSSKGEIALAAAVRIQVPLAFFLGDFTIAPTVKRRSEARVIHEFGRPPQPRDLESLTLSKHDVHALARCMPGDCAFKLSASMMDQFHDGHGSQRLFRNLVFEYLTQYLQKGNAAMITYADKRPPVRSADAFHQLLGQFE